MRAITEDILRLELRNSQPEVYYIPTGKILTPAAREYLQQRKIKIAKEGECPQRAPEGDAAPAAPQPAPQPVMAAPNPKYVDYQSGSYYMEKPEHMTQLFDNQLVAKNHPRILFRGKLDSLEAAILEAQALAHRQNAPAVRDGLGEVLEQVHLVLGAEVKDQPLEEVPILGMDQARLRQVSHNVKGAFGIDHPIPSWEMGELALRLNTLRTQVRETELAAAVAFEAPGETPRPDIIRALNRLSSAVYILFCKLLAEK